MQVKTFCKDCEKSYFWVGDDGSVLDCGCELDLPIFKENDLIICNSFKMRNSRKGL